MAEEGITKEAEDFKATVPPPPGDASSASELEHDDSNLEEEFFSELSNEFDKDDGISVDEEESPVSPPIEEPQPAPVSQSAEEPPAAASISEEAPAPTPTSTPAPTEEKPSAVQPQQEPAAGPDPEELKKLAKGWSDDLTRRYTDIVTDEVAAQVIAEPQTALPALLKQVHMAAVEDAARMMQGFVPQQAGGVTHRIIESQLNQRAFFKKNPDLAGKRAEVDKFVAEFRALPQNQGVPFNQIANKVAMTFRAMNGMPMRSSVPQPPPVARPPSAPPPPAASGASLAPAQKGGDFWQDFADEILTEDF